MDRENVIECLQKAKMVIETWVPMFEQYNTPAGIDDVIALLKQQGAEIEQLNRFINGFSRDAIPVVRCKDCKYGEKVNSVYLCGKSRGFGIAHEPDWFCADGEQRG
jgi:hypothetical protein